MKKIFYFISIYIFLFQTISAQSGWVVQSSGTSEYLQSVFFIDQNNGWIAGLMGVLLKTTDSGTNWIIQNSGTTEGLNSVFFINQTVGWVVGSNGIIKKTTDSGNSWLTQYTNDSFVLKCVKFIDENIGWAVGFGYQGFNGITVKTTNGGVTWYSQYIPNCAFMSVDFSDTLNGWIAGIADAGGIGESAVFKTTNGGTDWSFQTFGIFATLHSICFVDQYNGWFCGEGAVIFHTTDGGDNWNFQSSGTSGHLYSIHFVDQNFGWAVGTAGLIIKTTDGGLNWENNSIQPQYYLESVYFVNQNIGWAVGNDGAIFNTTNGGYHHDIDLLLPNGGEIIASNSEYEITWSSQNIDLVNIYLSLDNGASWSTITLSYPSYNGSNNGFVWNVPDTTSAQCLIKIEDSSDPSFYDISENTFKIIELPRFSYFPLSVGNIWYFSSGHDGVIKYKVEVEKDTLLDDSNTYAKLRQFYTPNDSLLYEFYLRKENNKIIRYPEYTALDFEMNIGDSVTSVFEYPYSAELSEINLRNVFGRYLSTYYFDFTQYDYYSYTDSIGFNTWVANTWTNYFPKYLLGCIIDGVSYGLVGVEE